MRAQRARGRPVKFIFYEKAGHLLFEGPLEKVTVRRGESFAFSAYQGADEGVLEQYEHDVIAFAKSHLAQSRRPPLSSSGRIQGPSGNVAAFFASCPAN